MLALTHLVCAGWVRKLKTSVIAFDIAQFFPSLNHEFLIVVMEQQGFPPETIRFFQSYLILFLFFIFYFYFFKSGPCAPIYYAVLDHNPRATLLFTIVCTI